MTGIYPTGGAFKNTHPLLSPHAEHKAIYVNYLRNLRLIQEAGNALKAGVGSSTPSRKNSERFGSIAEQ